MIGAFFFAGTEPLSRRMAFVAWKTAMPLTARPRARGAPDAVPPSSPPPPSSPLPPSSPVVPPSSPLLLLFPLPLNSALTEPVQPTASAPSAKYTHVRIAECLPRPLARAPPRTQEALHLKRSTPRLGLPRFLRGRHAGP